MIRHAAIALALLLGSAALAVAQPGPLPPSVAIDQRLDEQVPLNLVFRDEQDQPVELRQFFTGKPVILVLAYYRCPRLCSLVLNGLVEGLDRIDYEIGRQFTIVTVSIDSREKPGLAAAKKAAYIEQYHRPGAERGWHFLTGDDDAIQRLAASVGFGFVYDAQRDQFAHDSGIMMLTPEGKVARYFYGIEYPPRDLRFGLEDASLGKIGSPIGRPLRLLCFAYDPASGTYTLVTMRLLQIASVLTVLAIVVYVLLAWRRERHRPPACNLPTTG